MKKAFMFLKSYIIILRVKKILKTKGLQVSIRKLLWPCSRKHSSRGKLPNATDFAVKHIEDVIDSACHWQLSPTLCVPRAITAYVLLSDNGFEPILNVGVKTEPLVAHAWVAVDGKSVADSYPEDDKQKLKLLLQYPERIGTETTL